MTDAEKLALTKKHTPILWLHEEEAFLPEDCKIVVKISDLCTGKRGGKIAPKQPQKIDDLGDVKNSDKTLLRFRDFHLDEKVKELGPRGVGNLGRSKYHYSLSSISINGSMFNRTLPKYYARVSEFTCFPGDTSQVFSRFFRQNDKDVFGPYYLIEYFFYFIFNDAWNMHQSDWDSMVKIYINRNSGRKYVTTHMHHAKWVSRWPDPSGSQTVVTWLDGWNNLKKKELGEVFVRGDHPYVFVSLRGHGGYPTPGFTLHGIDLPGIVSREDILITTDERQLGGTCIVPGGVNTNNIGAELQSANVNTTNLRFHKWSSPELVNKQPWLKYKGLWGDASKFKGWSGPQNPPISKKPTKTDNWKTFGKDLQFQIADGYKNRTVMDSWHGVG